MSNFRLNLPVDIPWTLIDSSADMMDPTFCNKKSPSPFKSSLAIYAFEPKPEELPEELCGRRITYLKVSCTITGFQPSAEEKEQIVELLEASEVSYSKIEQIVGEYFGCYGVLLNVSVHPVGADQVKDFDTYPRIVDFEPKTRDFYQAASETGEVLTTSFGKVSTNKSFGSTDTTESSWKAGADASIDAAAMAAMTGVPVGLVAKGSTGQVRSEMDQENWATTTDASRERKETQATTTQLSQMYNLLTGYHTGSNRAAFIMLPRPHILQPTDRRTFVQGLRIIEGVQDFFLVVVRPGDQERMQVDAHLQTGHFPENIEIAAPSDEEKFDTLTQIFHVTSSFTNEDTYTIVGDGHTTKNISKRLQVVDEANGWQADPNKGDAGHGGVKQIVGSNTVTITEVDTETGEVLSSHDETVSNESGTIEDVEYSVTGADLLVTATLKLRRRNATEVARGIFSIAQFDRAYKVFTRRPKINAPVPVADVAGLLITQRTLCVDIVLGKCLQKFTLEFPDVDLGGIVIEPPFDIDDLFDIPSLGGGIGGVGIGGIAPGGTAGRRRTARRAPRGDFAFKKALLRRIQQTLVTAGSSPLRYAPGSVGYLQSRHFQRRLLKVLPSKVLDQPVSEVRFLDSEAASGLSMSLRELLSEDPEALKRLKLSTRALRERKTRLFRP